MKNYFSFIAKDPALVACSAVLNFFLSSYLMAQTIEEVIVTHRQKLSIFQFRMLVWL